MTKSGLIHKIIQIDAQIHRLKATAESQTINLNSENIKRAAKDWLETSKKIGNRWPKSAPAVLEMTRKDRRH